MNYNLTEISYPSSDGKNTVYAEIYTPKHKTAVGIVQLAHGMIDYTARYLELADYLTGKGYIFAGNHHLGHGRTAASEEDFGFIADKDGAELLIDDVYLMNRRLKENFPALPIVLMGHSMGSFIARLYTAKYPDSVQGVIIHGTGGANPLVNMGLLVAKLIKTFYGARHRSGLIDSLAFGSYNSKYPKEEGENAWLTREIELVADRQTNPFTSFKFTTAGYIDLFTLLKRSNSAEWYKAYPKDMPTLVVSGDMDPVGDYGKGPLEVYKKLLVEGLSNIDLKIYEGARHELFKETNRLEVFADLVAWIDEAIR